MTKVYLAPAEGLSIPLPDGRPWPAGGDWVVHDTYIRRRLSDGDLVEATPPASAEPVPAAEQPGESSTDPSTSTPSRRRPRS